MAFRDRSGQQSGWDDEADGLPPVWEEPPPTQTARGRGDSFRDLPAWSSSQRSETDWESEEDEVRRDARPSRSRSERPTESTPWPSLRDSLRGHSTPARAPRQTRTPQSDEVRSRSYGYEPETFEAEYPWPLENDRDEAVPGIPHEEPRRQQRRASAAPRTQSRARRSVNASPSAGTVATAHARPPLQLANRLGSLTAGQDPVVTGSIGLSVASLLMMAVVVSTQSNAVSPWFISHVNAGGAPDQWSTAEAIWRLPLTLAILSVGSVATALYIGRRDAFASRFLLASTLLIHLLGWVGLSRIIW